MPNFIIPFFNFLISFITLAICARYLFSKKGWLWIVPLFLSIIFSLISALDLLSKVSNVPVQTGFLAVQNNNILLVILILWFFTLLSFRYAIRNFGSKTYSSKINKNESNYLDSKNRNEPKFKEY